MYVCEINKWSKDTLVTSIYPDGRIAHNQKLPVRYGPRSIENVTVEVSQGFISFNYHAILKNDGIATLQRFYYAIRDEKLALIRIEDESGNNITWTSVLRDNSSEEDFVPFDYVAWKQDLNSNDRLNCLFALNDLPNECSGWRYDAEVASKLIELKASPDRWIAEAAAEFENQRLKTSQ
ncbi:MAG: hypothetical protein QM811_14740 [Pirellulales bacterium]